MRHPRQSDIDRLVQAARKAEVERFAVVLREVDGKFEAVLIVDAASVPQTPTVPKLG